MIDEKKPLIVSGVAFSEDVCEHCLGGVFKDNEATGVCKIGPPATGMMVVPTQVQPTPANPQGIQMMMHQYTAFAKVERREFCMAFELREAEVAH